MTSTGPDFTTVFATIRADYEFFLAHSTETAAQLDNLRAHLVRQAARSGALRILDFGCGTGSFTAALLAASGIPRERLDLELVEPVAPHRAEAAARLAPLAASVEGRDWAEGSADRDLILANHCLYYVPDLPATAAVLAARLAPGGCLIAALQDRANPLARLWREGYATVGRPLPVALAEEAEEGLRAAGLAVERETITYRVRFPDRPENALKVLRFLFGPELAGMRSDIALALFDPYRHGGTIGIDATYPHLVARH